MSWVCPELLADGWKPPLRLTSVGLLVGRSGAGAAAAGGVFRMMAIKKGKSFREAKARLARMSAGKRPGG
jgi:hypothetical protein